MTPRMRLNLLLGLATEQQRANALRSVLVRVHETHDERRYKRATRSRSLHDCADMLTLDEVTFAADELARIIAGHPSAQQTGAQQ